MLDNQKDIGPQSGAHAVRNAKNVQIGTFFAWQSRARPMGGVVRLVNLVRECWTTRRTLARNRGRTPSATQKTFRSERFLHGSRALARWGASCAWLTSSGNAGQPEGHWPAIGGARRPQRKKRSDRNVFCMAVARSPDGGRRAPG